MNIKNQSKNSLKVVILIIPITSFFSLAVAMERADYAQTKQISLMDLLIKGDFEKAKRIITGGKLSQNEMDSALIFTIQINQAGLISLLISKGANINAVDMVFWTPLHWMAYKNNKEVVEFLVRNGANLNAVDSDGWTPLHLAACKNHKEAVEILIKGGANVNASARTGRTPLHWAVLRNYKESVELLIKGGADINGVDNDRWTSLHWIAASISADRNDKNMVKYLLFEGANYKKKGKYQETASDVAKKDSIKAILKDEKSIEKAIQSVRKDIKREICVTKCNGTNMFTVVMQQQIIGSFKPNRKLASYLQ